MKRNIFIYGGINPNFIKEIYKNFNVCFSIHSNPGVEKNEDHQNLILNNFQSIPKIEKKISKMFIDFYNENIITFLKMFVRKNISNSDFHEDNNHFSLYFYSFYEILITKKIDLVIFNSFPHQGPDFILYQLAKKLNIQTILFHQTIFPNKYIIISDLKDYGKYKKAKNSYDTKEIEKILSLKNIYSKFQLLTVLENKKRENNLFSTILNSFKKKNFFKRVILKILISLKIINRPDHERDYEKKITEVSINKDQILKLFNNKEKKILYFPLQSQPEMITSLCAEDYDDQLRVVERLNSVLDDSWVIIIKDHYIQTSYQRKKLFFRRLKSFKNIFFLDKNHPSNEILDKAQVVVTVGGTSGWEALIRKKKCLLFGNSWYSDLHGVLKVSDKTNDEEIINHINNLFEEKKFNLDLVNLYNSFYDGLLSGLDRINFNNEIWKNLLNNNYNEKENTKILVSNLKRYIRENKL